MRSNLFLAGDPLRLPSLAFNGEGPVYSRKYYANYIRRRAAAGRQNRSPYSGRPALVTGDLILSTGKFFTHYSHFLNAVCP